MDSRGIHSLLFRDVDDHSLETGLTNFACNLLFVLGVIGNVLAWLIFSSAHRSWQTSPVYSFLASCSSVTNLLCLVRYAATLHSASRHALHQLVGHRWWACKFYEFSFSFRLVSAWITLLWTVERALGTSNRLRPILNRWNSSKLKFIIPLLAIGALVGGVVGPPVFIFEPQTGRQALSSSFAVRDDNEAHCGLPPNVSLAWLNYFHEVTLGRNYHTIRCLFSELIPAAVITLLNTFILYEHRVYRQAHRPSLYRLSRRQSYATSWMNAVLIVHSLLYLSTVGIHMVGHAVTVEVHETWWMSLAVVANCSMNFYFYCLSGRAFRIETRRFIQRVETRLFYH